MCGGYVWMDMCGWSISRLFQFIMRVGKTPLGLFIISAAFLLFLEYHVGLRHSIIDINQPRVSERHLREVKENLKARKKFYECWLLPSFLSHINNELVEESMDLSLEWNEAPLEWRQEGGIADMFAEFLFFQTQSDTHRKEVRENCSKIQLESMEDYRCRAEWRVDLFQGEIVGIEDVMGFSSLKLAAIKFILSSGRKVWFKPCGKANEMPENEVIASVFAELLSYHRVAPVVMRNVSFSAVERMFRNKFSSLDPKFQTLKQLEDVCSMDGRMEGAMIGWWDDVEDSRTISKKLTNNFTSKDVSFLRSSLSQDWASQITQNHAYFFLVGIVRRIGYNEYAIHQKGEKTLISLDLDKLSFAEGAEYAMEEVSICYLCKFTASMYDQYQSLKIAQNRIGEALQLALLYDQHPIAIPFRSIQRITKRIENLTKCFETCIAVYGRDNVLH